MTRQQYKERIMIMRDVARAIRRSVSIRWFTIGVLLLTVLHGQVSGQPVGASSAPLFPVTVVDGRGQRVTIARRPLRIVSLFDVNNEPLFAIGAGSQVVAVDDFTDYPPAAVRLPHIGGNNFQFDVERILALHPDLILTSDGVPTLEKQAAAAGIPVLRTPYPGSLAGILQNITLLGMVSGQRAAATTLRTQLLQRIDAVRHTLAQAHLPGVGVYLETDQSTPTRPYTVGPGSLEDQLIGLAGGTNIFHTARQSYPQVNWEEIIHANPQVILLGDAVGYVAPYFLNPTTVAAVRARRGWGLVAAVRQGHIVPIHDAGLAGPRVVSVLEEIARAIHPAIFAHRAAG